jgi:hypothetical protein
MIYELTARFDSRQSFYGKATLKEHGDNITLLSYNTEILSYNTKTHKIKWLTKYAEHFTQTTNRHINEFFKQFTNERARNKSELLKMAGIN